MESKENGRVYAMHEAVLRRNKLGDIKNDVTCKRSCDGSKQSVPWQPDRCLSDGQINIRLPDPRAISCKIHRVPQQADSKLLTQSKHNRWTTRKPSRRLPKGGQRHGALLAAARHSDGRKMEKLTRELSRLD